MNKMLATLLEQDNETKRFMEQASHQSLVAQEKAETSKVGEVRSLIEKISCQVEEVERSHGAILSSSNQDKRYKDELELQNSEIKKNGNIVRVKLNSMQQNLPVDDKSTCVSAMQRIQKNQINCDARTTSQALSEIESRHQDIICLESSIKELHEIFVDTAMLLEIQGEILNNIEKNVTSAAEYVDESKAETHKAVTYKKNPYKIASLPSFFKPFKR
ncbi:Syntaxin-2 Epimorphin [Channa argus]|uniref:Syntaxin-2 Epimorphin n=1 Tax=Channa argus TaxID=215402 RepID=A0A6G1QHP8_CHAAH|nr:Syntaxin-2 Epimorphin [Channa argus]